MKLWEMEKRRKEKGYSYAEVARAVDLPEEEVRCILNRQVDCLYIGTAFALKIVVTAPELPTAEEVKRRVHAMLEIPTDTDPCCVKESGGYGVEPDRQGIYTVEDFYALPDECLPYMEMIDGVFYWRYSPTIAHQLVVVRLTVLIDRYIRQKKGGCKVLVSPVDVLLDEDDCNVIKPDIFVLCDRNKINKECIKGAPDWVVEVLSKSTKSIDMKEKLWKYRAAGVKEYWMIDLELEKVIVYCFQEQEEAVIYGFGDIVPVGIYHGELKIDFKEVKAELEDMEYGNL